MNPPNLLTRRQLGGTLIGFVIGLLVGLGIALAVAVYVAHVPVPFIDRGLSRNPAQDAQEAEHNKGWNPNAGLTAGSGAPPTVAPPVSTPDAAAQAPAVSAPERPAEASAGKPASTTAPTDDPLGELMRARAGTGGDAPTTPTPAPSGTTVASTAAADPFIYFVQAGAFRTPEDAQAQRARLAMLGMAADISEREQSGRTVFRVRVGPFNQKPMAQATLEQLEVSGVEAAMVRVAR